MWVEVEVECSIGESLACVKGRNSKPLNTHQVVGLGMQVWAGTDTPSLECVLVHMLIP